MALSNAQGHSETLVDSLSLVHQPQPKVPLYANSFDPDDTPSYAAPRLDPSY